MSDIWTIVWKEWIESIFPGGKLVSLGPIFFIALLGVIFPLIDRLGWLTLSTAMVLLSVFFPYYYILIYIGDAFAGERERHTLATLLASRISDRAILWGKVIATVCYIWGMAVIASLAILIFSLLACLLASSGGILVSLHSATVRQAQQILAIGSLALFVVIYLVLRALPPQLFLGMSSSQMFLIAMLVIAVLDAILLGISMASFHRSRLILS